MQPLDQGIIYSFKARYKKWYLRWLLTQTQVDASAIDRLPKLKPDLREAIVTLHDIWDALPSQVIQSCWRRANVMPLEDDAPTNNAAELLIQRQQDTAEIQELIRAVTSWVHLAKILPVLQ